MTFAPRDVVHLDVSRALPDSLAASAGRGVYVVLWHGRRPVGDLHLPPSMLPLSSSALLDLVSREVGAWLTTRWSETGDPGSPDWGHLSRQQNHFGIAESMHRVSPTVSVVVCSRDRPQDLRRCLEGLHRCDPGADEVIVVDNASQSSQTREVVAEFPGVRYIFESRVGLDIARNTGAQAAHGDVVAYVDDDVHVYPQWISCIRNALDDDSVMALTGLVLPRQLDTRAQWIFESDWGFNRGYHGKDFGPDYFRRRRLSGVPAWEVGAGANMAFRREVFDCIGYFDVRLDVGAAGCSGDSEYWYRVMAAGLKCRYDPRVVVDHRHRETMADLERQLFAYMRGHTAALLVQFERHRHWGNLARLGFWLPLYYLKRIVHRVVFGPSDSFASIRHELQGCLSGVLFYLRSISLDRRKWRNARVSSPPSTHPSTRGVPETPPPLQR